MKNLKRYKMDSHPGQGWENSSRPKMVFCVTEDDSGAWVKFSDIKDISKTPTNTTNGKINPCSNKECEYHNSIPLDHSNCEHFLINELDGCGDYRS